MGGISFSRRTRSARSHIERDRTTDSRSSNSENTMPAVLSCSPWQLEQYVSRRGWISPRNDASSSRFEGVAQAASAHAKMDTASLQLGAQCLRGSTGTRVWALAMHACAQVGTRIDCSWRRTSDVKWPSRVGEMGLLKNPIGSAPKKLPTFGPFTTESNWDPASHRNETNLGRQLKSQHHLISHLPLLTGLVLSNETSMNGNSASDQGRA